MFGRLRIGKSRLYPNDNLFNKAHNKPEMYGFLLSNDIYGLPEENPDVKIKNDNSVRVNDKPYDGMIVDNDDEKNDIEINPTPKKIKTTKPRIKIQYRDKEVFPSWLLDAFDIDENTDFNNQHTLLQLKIEEYKEMYQDTMEENRVTKETNQNLLKQITQRDTLLETHKQKYQEAQNKLLQQLQNLKNSKNEELVNQISELQNKISSHDESYSLISQKNVTLQNQLENTKSKLRSTMSKLNVAQSSLTNKDNELRATQNQLAKNNAWQSRYNKLNERFDTLKNQFDSYKDESQRGSQDWNKRYTQLNEENEKLKKQYQNLDNNFQRKAKEYTAQKNENQQLKNKLQLNQGKDREIFELQNENQKLKTQIENLNSNINTNNNSNQGKDREIFTLKEENAKLNKKGEELSKKAKHMENKFKQAYSQLTASKTETQRKLNIAVNEMKQITHNLREKNVINEKHFKDISTAKNPQEAIKTLSNVLTLKHQGEVHSFNQALNRLNPKTREMYQKQHKQGRSMHDIMSEIVKYLTRSQVKQESKKNIKRNDDKKNIIKHDNKKNIKKQQTKFKKPQNDNNNNNNNTNNRRGSFNRNPGHGQLSTSQMPSLEGGNNNNNRQKDDDDEVMLDKKRSFGGRINLGKPRIKKEKN